VSLEHSPARDEKLLTLRQLAKFLTEQGYPTGHGTLAKLVMPSCGLGPPKAARWGNKDLYSPSRALRWAKDRLRPASDEAA
jgi:hypothetical protein